MVSFHTTESLSLSLLRLPLRVHSLLHEFNFFVSEHLLPLNPTSQASLLLGTVLGFTKLFFILLIFFLAEVLLKLWN